MSTTAVTPSVDDDPFAKFAKPSSNQPTTSTPSADSDDPFAKFAAGQPQQPTTNPDQYASDTRQMLVSGLTGMPTPNMTDADKASFARGKEAGAISVPVVAGATTAASLTPELALQILGKAPMESGATSWLEQEGSGLLKLAAQHPKLLTSQ